MARVSMPSILVLAAVIFAGISAIAPLSGQDAPFLRGDCNVDGILSIGDAISALQYVFSGGATPHCLDACDADDDGVIGLIDGMRVLNFLFTSGAAPAPPHPDPGLDPTPADSLDCVGLLLQSSITQYGITWIFDQPHRVGRYVTGDYWVVGPVTVIEKLPLPTGDRHGSMLNPPSARETAYDSRIRDSDMGLGVTFPVTLQPGASLVSVESWDTDPPHTDLIGFESFHEFRSLKNAAVLTVVSTPPSATAFRPPYTGNDRPEFDTRDIQWQLLPALQPQGGSLFVVQEFGLAGDSPAEIYERFFERPWLCHATGRTGRDCAPTENQPGYYRESYNTVADAAMILLCNPTVMGDQEKLLIGFLQVGIDMHYCAKDGIGIRALNKWPTIFAGLLFDHEEMQHAAYEGWLNHGYRTDFGTYYADENCSPRKSSVVPDGEGWTGATVLFRMRFCEHEHEHLSPWPGAGEWQQVPGWNPTHQGGISMENYRRFNTPGWIGIALAARIMGAVGLWDHPPFFEYVDRWMTEPDAEHYLLLEGLWNYDLAGPGQTASSRFTENLWWAYRPQY